MEFFYRMQKQRQKYLTAFLSYHESLVLLFHPTLKMVQL